MHGKEDTIFKDVSSSGVAFQNNDGDNDLHIAAEDSVPSFSVWNKLVKTNRTRVIVTSAIFVVIGAVVGATISGLVVAQMTKNSLNCTASNFTVNGLHEKKLNGSGFQEEDGCDVMYKGKCFKAIIRYGRTVHLNESKRMCESIGWKLANIYSRSHYFMIEGYLRSKHSASTHISAWTGMTILPKNYQLVLSNGMNINISGISWYTGYPSNNAIYTHVGIDVIEFPSQKNVKRQGLWNFDPTWNGDTALCEK